MFILSHLVSLNPWPFNTSEIFLCKCITLGNCGMRDHTFCELGFVRALTISTLSVFLSLFPFSFFFNPYLSLPLHTTTGSTDRKYTTPHGYRTVNMRVRVNLNVSAWAIGLYSSSSVNLTGHLIFFFFITGVNRLPWSKEDSGSSSQTEVSEKAENKLGLWILRAFRRWAENTTTFLLLASRLWQ